MEKLTPDYLRNFPFDKFTSQAIIERGCSYYKHGAVLHVNLKNDQEAECQVSGSGNNIYNVTLKINKSDGRLQYKCNCPYTDLPVCKHIVAASLAVADYLDFKNLDPRIHETTPIQVEDHKNEPEEKSEILGEDILQDVYQEENVKEPALPEWESKIHEAALSYKMADGPTVIQKDYILFLQIINSAYSYQNFDIHICAVNEKNGFKENSLRGKTNSEITDVLTQSFEWVKFSEAFNKSFQPKGCINLSEDNVRMLQFIIQNNDQTPYKSSRNQIPLTNYFDTAAQMGIPTFYFKNRYDIKPTLLKLMPEYIDSRITFSRGADGITVYPELILPDQKVLFDHPVQIQKISLNPDLYMAENIVFRAASNKAAVLFEHFPIQVSTEEISSFRRNSFPKIVSSFPIDNPLGNIREITAEPIPRLYLIDSGKRSLLCELRFGYDSWEIPCTHTNDTQLAAADPDTWNLIKVCRNFEKETEAFQLLSGTDYGLKKTSGSYPYGTFTLRSHVSPYTFLTNTIPLLSKKGFEIYGEENLKNVRINHAAPHLAISIKSNMDWFDLDGTIQFGDQEISLSTLRRALKQDKRYIKLADGSIGQIPEKWIEKFNLLFSSSHAADENLKITKFQIPVLDSLDEEITYSDYPAELKAEKEKLRHFSEIEKQDLPHGLKGILRPYQTHGYDWLHFLKNYGFGGILADDMGLGKTAQILTFLLSLKERAESNHQPHPITLLIIPKSLIENWQNESEKFTPDLKILSNVGFLRTKETTQFTDYDIILTTYGTMLKDAKILKEFHFNQIILDESQAIKNPLAKSSKAVRHFKADSRFVMTGTPIENNTLELWSQFDFINPGLLGNLDTFRKEYASPIEIHHDEAKAESLRKLVYPFILRRTKKQAAPELPPKTERIIYLDMDPAQEALYKKTSARYRNEIISAIAQKGMNGARFKIIEGLLRLRQIAIHPALVEPNSTASSPKLDYLMEAAETLENESHKTLIFSQFVQTLHIVQNEMDERKINYAYLDGNTRNREAAINSFQTDPAIQFFLISIKAGGVGLNLTAADYVIHLDPWWNPAVEMQADDRAYRIGQDKPVFVYKLIMRKTVEEKILKLQESKRKLVDTLITSDAAFLKALTPDDINSLFE